MVTSTVTVLRNSARKQGEEGGDRGGRPVFGRMAQPLPTVAPGPTAGALRFVSLALHILPHKGERRRRHVSARKVPEPYFHPETHFSKAQVPVRAHNRENRQRTASLDELAEPNHYSKRRETSSTRVFASHISGSGSSE